MKKTKIVYDKEMPLIKTKNELIKINEEGIKQFIEYYNKKGQNKILLIKVGCMMLFFALYVAIFVLIYVKF